MRNPKSNRITREKEINRKLKSQRKRERKEQRRKAKQQEQVAQTTGGTA